jgi:methylated-DNA-[protein]-cysteine S-methyltransferase
MAASIVTVGNNVVKVTPYRQRVYDACSQIPMGKVSTYKLLAEEIDCHSSQAVGQALRHNPFAPRVPCHRVVSSNLKLHGFSGKTDGASLNRKRKMLEEEGVTFDEQGRVQPECVYKFSTKNK